MSNPEPPSPILFFQTLTAYQKSGALKGALDLDLFTAVGKDGGTAPEIAARVKASERGVRILCDYLTVLGFLTKENGRYRLTPDSATFLDRTSPAYAGGTAEFLLSESLTGMFDDIAAAVRKGSTVLSEHGTMDPEHPVWLSFARGMGAMMMPTSQRLADMIPLEGSRDTKVLDISASHGLWGLAFARKKPRTTVVGLDWAPVLKVAWENAGKFGLADRFQTIEGSAFEVDLGSDYDLVLLPNFLHHFDPNTCGQLLRKVHAALRPGGKVAVVEFVPNPDRVSPPDVATFSLVMLASTTAGDAYTFAELESMLTGAGFNSVSQQPLPPGVETVLIATRS